MERDECACGHMIDEHSVGGFTLLCEVEGCDCQDFEAIEEGEEEDESWM